MKKIVAIVLALVMVLSVSLATAEMTLGGWNIAESTEITEERQEVFDKAIASLMGVSYEPVAYLSSQVVAGVNHCFLCRATVIAPDQAPYYTLVYIYQALDGTATVSNVAPLDLAALSVKVEAEAVAAAE